MLIRILNDLKKIFFILVSCSTTLKIPRKLDPVRTELVPQIVFNVDTDKTKPPLKNHRRGLTNLTRIKKGLAKFRDIPRDNSNGISKKEKAMLKKLLHYIRRMNAQDLEDLLVLLSFEE